MAVEELLKLVGLGPPGDWTNVRARWNAIESEFGRLPNDYKTFCSAAGTGCLGEFFWIFDPFTANLNLNFRHQALSLIACSGEARISFPATGGLLPFGVTTNGELLHWRNSGEPDKWTVSIQIARAQEVIDFSSGMSDFLMDVLTGKVTVPSFPKGIGRLYPPAFRRT